MRRWGLVSAMTIGISVGCSDRSEPETPLARLDVQEAAATITAADFASRVGVIAHDSMLGRATPSPGLDMTAEWAAALFGSLGLRAGGDDGGFIQRYPLASTVVDVERASGESGAISLEFGEHLLPAVMPLPNREVEADLIVVSGLSGYTDDLEERLRGQHVLLVLRPGERPGRELASAITSIDDAGAASVLITSPFAEEQWSRLAEGMLEPTMVRAWTRQTRSPDELPIRLHIRRDAAARLLDGSGLDLDALAARTGAAARVEEVDRRVTIRSAVRDVAGSAPNVVALLEGSDPELRSEYVVFSAHIDHVGVRPPNEAGDSIFNGADDDASGTVAVIEVAEAMASLATPPRRSMLFLLVSGEERGLWGSEWFAEHPAVPIESMVANLNADMIGRNWPDTIVAIGKEHSDLGETLDRVNAAHPEIGMTAIDDLWPDERFYFRSDHYNFAKKGVPILFFFNGTHDDYHGPDDEPDRIDAEKASRIAKLLFYLGLEIGDAPARPEWDRTSYRQVVTDR